MIRLTTLLCAFCLSVVSQNQKIPATLPDNLSNLPVQKIGVDDLIGISVYDSPELTRTVRVGTDGAIRLPMVKARIHIAGMFPSDIENAISAELTKEEIMVDPIVTVSIVESRSRPIVVSGAVKSPLTFQASGETTLLNALAQAGGLSDTAGPEILVTGLSNVTQRIPVKELLDGADSKVNIALQGGEQIRIPEAARVYVVGNVREPGAFPLHNESQTTVLRALSLSKGVLPFTADKAFIYRKEGGAKSSNEIPIDLKKILGHTAPDIALLPDDVLFINDRSGRRTLARALEIIGGGVGGAAIYTTVR